MTTRCMGSRCHSSCSRNPSSNRCVYARVCVARPLPLISRTNTDIVSRGAGAGAATGVIPARGGVRGEAENKNKQKGCEEAEGPNAQANKANRPVRNLLNKSHSSCLLSCRYLITRLARRRRYGMGLSHLSDKTTASGRKVRLAHWTICLLATHFTIQNQYDFVARAEVDCHGRAQRHR